MKNILKILLLSGLTTMFISCEHDTNEPNTANQTTDSFESNEVIYNLLDYTPNVYHDYFANSNTTVGFSSIKANPLAEHYDSQRNQFISEDGNLKIEINKFSVLGKGGLNKMSKNQISDIYGKEITIGIRPSIGNTFKDGEERKEVSMYVPKKINITNPRVEEEKDVLPYCYYKDFVLEWNADPKNEEGLVVVAEYYGANAIPGKDWVPSIINTDIIADDNGKTILDNNLWEGIPNSAVVHLSILRGNVKLEKVDGEVIKFYAETHAELPVVLIKDMNTLQLEQ